VVDAHPEDAHVVDFYYPNGTARYWSIGDYRQLVDALFHAGTNSGSEFEYQDLPNGLHFYVLDTRRDGGVLKYTVGVRSTSTNTTSSASYGIEVSEGKVDGSYCTFDLKNTGTAPSNSTSSHPQDLSAYLGSDIYRLSAKIDSESWKVGIPNAVAHAKFGSSTSVKVAFGAATNGTSYGTSGATMTLIVTSESDPKVTGTAICKI
tara:strand:- start:8085 stop:8699 length:615 start_codon:yes stop_codon:yes gene_type:complete